MDSVTVLVNVTAHSIYYPYFLHELTCNSLNVCSRLGANVLKTCNLLCFHSHSVSPDPFPALRCYTPLCVFFHFFTSAHTPRLCDSGNTSSLFDLLLNLALHSLSLCATGNVIRGRSDFPVIATRIVSAPLSHFANSPSNWVSPAIRSITTLILEFNIL